MTQTADEVILGAWTDELARPSGDPRAIWHGTGPQAGRPEQRLPPLDGSWRVFFLRGGRGSGKTRAGAQGLADIILADTDGEGEYGIIAPTYADAWTKCVEGESGILRALGTSMAEIKDHRSKLVRSAWRTYGQVVMHSGLVIYIDSADEGGLRIQGRNLKAAWCDEIGLWQKWEVAWGESLKYAVRQGVSVIIATGTPKVSQPARKLVRSLIRNEDEHGGVITRRLRTLDNIKNLSQAFYRTVIGSAKGTRLERQELEGELLEDVANALWTRELVEASQCSWVGEPGGPEFLTRVWIGVDPSDGKEESDEQAYTVVARGRVDDPHLYVIDSWGQQEPPVMFARRVVKKAQEFMGEGIPCTLVVEKNHGGEWLAATFRQVMKETGVVPFETVTASKAKRTRAEPVSGLYDRGIVRHCQKRVTYQMTDPRSGEVTWHTDVERFTDLEDQMCIAAGELVTTGRGDVPVEQVHAGDLVLTRAGWRPVLRAGLTGVRQTVTISTDHCSVTCTEDHPVYVSGRGFIRADEVQNDDTMVSCREPASGRSSSSAVRSSTSMTMVTTSPAAAVDASCCTVRSGPLSMGISRLAGMFTTARRAGAAMSLGIWWRCQPATTIAGISRSAARPARPLTRSVSAAPSARRNGECAGRGDTSARSAEPCTNPGRTSRRSTAPADAATGLWAASVRSVHASGVQPVYDLTVAGQPEFFAGGLLVHNCSFTGAAGERSPDRLDSLVWACHLSLDAWYGQPVPAGKREWAGGDDLDAGTDVHRHLPETLAEPHQPRRRRDAPDNKDEWDQADWAPRDDSQPQAQGSAPGVRRWR